MTGPGERPGLSVLVLALDEEELLERCLRSVSWADDVVVIDSGSTDRTREIAVRLGARVVEQPWLGWSGQRKAASQAAVHDWVMFLEADEIVTPELAASLQETLAAGADPRDGFSVDRRTEWIGDLLPNDQRPSMIRSFVRVFDRRHSEYDPEMVVHERVVVPGRTHLLDGILIHWRAETLSDRTARIIRYAGLEAQLADEHHRRQASVRRTVTLPVLRLVWLLFARHNLFDGTRGVLHALHKTNAEWMRQLMLFEHQQSGGLAPGSVARRAAASNDLGPKSRTGLARLLPVSWPVWWAVPALLGVALRGLRTPTHDVAPLLAAYDRWNTSWLRAAKAWEAAHADAVHRVHPPGYEPGP